MAGMPLLPRRRAAGIGIRNPDGKSWTNQMETPEGDIINTTVEPSPGMKKEKLR